MIIGYARVSTNDQDLSSQLDQLKQAGATKIYREKISGARSDRPELAKLMRSLGHGDVLLVTRLDRLARSTSDLLNVLDAVSKAGAAFKSLADAWADTTDLRFNAEATRLFCPSDQLPQPHRVDTYWSYAANHLAGSDTQRSLSNGRLQSRQSRFHNKRRNRSAPLRLQHHRRSRPATGYLLVRDPR